jgi:MFS family permease
VPQIVKILGLEAEKGRWLLILCGMVIYIIQGFVYAYSVVAVPLRKYFISLGLEPTAIEMQLPFMTSVIVATFLMPLTGRFIDRYGPRILAILGGIIVGLSRFGSSFATSPTTFTLLFGVVGGVGGALLYNCPIAAIERWFPDKRGLALGLTVFGFGFSTAVMGPLADYLIAIYGIQTAFRILGVLSTAVILTCALPLRFPPNGWTPRKWKWSTVSASVVDVNLTPGEMIKTRAFYGLWLCFFIGTSAGLLGVGVAKLVGLEVAKNAGILEAEASSLLTALMIPFATCNASGRPLFGWLTDRLGPKKVAITAFTLVVVVSLLIYTHPSSIAIYALTFSILWLTLGGWMSIAPTLTARFFGVKHYASNYGIVMTAYGVGNIVGNTLAGLAKDVFGSYIKAFPCIAALTGIGIFIALAMLKPPNETKILSN